LQKNCNFFTKLKISHEQVLGVLQITCFLVSQFVVWLRVQKAVQEIRKNRSILNRVRLYWARRAEACIANDGRHFEQLL
jgi:hypothetical protein